MINFAARRLYSTTATVSASVVGFKWPLTVKQIKNIGSNNTASAEQLTTNDASSSSSSSAGSKVGDIVTVKGWIKNMRHQKQFSFAELTDGSCVQGLQVIGTPQHFAETTNGCCVSVTGKLTQSPGKNQSLEIQLFDEQQSSGDNTTSGVKVLGKCDDSEYPLQPKQHSFEFLRDIAHLRSRSNTIGAMIRVRNESTSLIHTYFQDRQFQHVHTPLITASDCEGGGEQFAISTPVNHPNNNKENNKATTTPAVNHFFGEPAYLTVSGQLEAEIFASSHSRVYTFGPSFRAEKSNTTRHLSEFWMVEPEMSFINMQDNLDIAEDFLKYTIQHLMTNCKDDMEFFNKLEKTLTNRFVRLPYTEAIDILTKQTSTKFANPIKWGEDLSREHEKYLTSHFGDIPVFVINWPKDIKPFYMRENDDGQTVANMDLLVPEVGELIGGSIREERYDHLVKRLNKLDMDQDVYGWYMDLRKYGSAPHGGFGLGFERFLQYVTGLQNIRDVIPIPRHQNYCKF
ncbi:asparagine-tRNA ligase [Cavenderia fasciculata]|uniref:asparagine--tRNA ligase n=1 Tax=Cavenderia fasciculata TaxID=261658 RepID=F4Q414_CACFS|nr:asparagine-tRNA ligase [Cavenderia fasciculata]EGG16928.1 asparagine-tRNA ligase [Cavenderia fasciculata]|eukprot:XP_004355402.1 asparagine-tRNA ligase [Cavenderia fasciculata]